jgi:hypothetical protein
MSNTLSELCRHAHTVQPWAGVATVNDWAAFVVQVQLDTTASHNEACQWLLLWSQEGLQPHQAYLRTLECSRAGYSVHRMSEALRDYHAAAAEAEATVERVRMVRSHRRPPSFARQVFNLAVPFVACVVFGGACLVGLVTSL